MTIQEELHNVKNTKTLKDFNELFTKINNLVKEEVGVDVFTFLKSRENLANTVNYKTTTEWSYKNDSIARKIKELEIEEMYNDLSGMEGL